MHARVCSRLVAVVAAMLVLAIAGVVLLLATAGHSQWLKNRLSRVVLEGTQRTLTIDGDLDWTLSMTPAIVIRLGHATLSERNGTQVFAAIDDARISLRLRPLLSRQVVIDRIELSGLKATVVRHADGTLNIDDLLAPHKRDGNPLQFSVGSMHVSAGEFVWLDEAASRRATLGDIRFDAGPLARTAAGALEFSAQLRASPVDEAGIRLKARYDLDFDSPTPRFMLDHIETQLSARAGATRFDGGMNASAAFDFPTQTLRFDDLVGTLAIAGTQPPLPPISLAGSLRADFARRTAGGRLTLTDASDDSHVVATFDVPSLAPLSLVADIDVDRFDADRFLPAHPSSGQANAAAPGASLPALPGFLRGTLRIGSLHIAGATLRNLHFALGDAAKGDGNLGALRIPEQADRTRSPGKNPTRKERHAARAPA